MTKKFNIIEKLRETGLRPTKQRVKICEVLYNREKTFHFTINDLVKRLSEELNEKISLATVYNTVHALQKKRYLKEISINSDKSYYDNIFFSPLTIIYFNSFFQGHIMFKEPKIKPVNKARVASL